MERRTAEDTLRNTRNWATDQSTAASPPPYGVTSRDSLYARRLTHLGADIVCRPTAVRECEELVRAVQVASMPAALDASAVAVSGGAGSVPGEARSHARACLLT